MRRIISKREEEKKKRIKQLLVGGVLVLIMFMSVLVFPFRNRDSETEDKIIYNGVKFTKQGNLWFADISGLQFAFSYNPKQTENISAIVFLNINDYYAKPLYIYYESKNFDAEAEIYRNLDQIVLRRQDACLEGENCTESRPMKTCEDNFIIIKESKENENDKNTEVRQEDNCIFIQGQKEDIVRSIDRFLFRILGVQ